MRKLLDITSTGNKSIIVYSWLWTRQRLNTVKIFVHTHAQSSER